MVTLTKINFFEKNSQGHMENEVDMNSLQSCKESW